MKNKFNVPLVRLFTVQSRRLCTAALIMAITFCFAACGDKSGSDGEIIDDTTGSSIAGNSIVSEMQVRYASSFFDEDEYRQQPMVIEATSTRSLAEARAQTDFSYDLDWNDPFDLDGKYKLKHLNFFLNGSPSVKIINGMVTITLGTPKSSEHMTNLAGEYDYDAVTVSDKNANCYEMWTFRTPKINGSISYTYSDGSSYDAPYSYTYNLYCEKDNGDAGLIYVDRDVTIRGTGTWGSYSVGTYTENYNVSLKKGWNYMLWSYNEKTNTYNITATTTFPSGYYWIVRWDG
jgi:hypothetical protein